MSVSCIVTFAQRGKVRPEWDIDYGNRTVHHINDDIWSFLLVVGIIIMVLAISYFSGVVKRKQKEQRYNYQTKDVENGCCLVYVIICAIALVAGLIVPWITGGGKYSKSNIHVVHSQRKDSTLVNEIISENNWKKIHKASKNEFKGDDTLFYYKSVVYKNMTGRDLIIYS